jgi:hypothetical protein
MLHSAESKFASPYSRIYPCNRNEMKKYFRESIRGLGVDEKKPEVENLVILSL